MGDTDPGPVPPWDGMDGRWPTTPTDPGPVPEDAPSLLDPQTRHDLALLTGEELLALFASAMIRQQQEVIELRDALGAAMRDNERLRAEAATLNERHDR